MKQVCNKLCSQLAANSGKLVLFMCEAFIQVDADHVSVGVHAAAVRQLVNKLCNQLAANSGKLALLMCEGFGIPDHLLQAPIAFDWMQIGTTWKHV